MTYKEIEKIAIENGWTTTSEATLYRIEKEYKDSTTNYIVIGKFNRNVIFIKNERCNPGDLIVIKAAIKLADTPPGERIPEEKFYLKHGWMKYAGNKDTEKYYNLNTATNLPYLGSKIPDEENQTEFTKKEIEDIKKKYKTSLEDYELVEVEDGQR